MQLKLLLLTTLFTGMFTINAFAQLKDSAAKVNDTTATKTATPKQKEIKKIDDPLLALPQELVYRLKKMTPNQLLVISERFVRNEKRVDESGEQYEVTVTVRLGFSQDMITGIVKEVPLYQSAERETNIIPVKIPVQFCCTTPIDTLHKKQHCGKMSELNDLEDNEHCKDWVQKDEAQVEAESAAGFGKAGGTKTTGKKKGEVTGKTSATEEGFGKPVPKGKPSKKGKNSKGQVEEEETTDSTKAVTKPPVVTSKEKGKNEKTEKTDKDKKPAPEAEEGFGKPQPKDKGKKKTNDKKPVAKDDGFGVPNYKEENNTDDSTKTEKKEPVDKKSKKKKG